MKAGQQTMSSSYKDSQQRDQRNDLNRENNRGNFRGGRGSTNRDGGGFRIRLSDNEMRAAKTIQDAFNLRSTVAVLGFAIRTLAQMLEEGKLDELLTEYRSQAPSGVSNRRDDRPRGNRGNRISEDRPSIGGAPKANPFARPPKPKSVSASSEAEESSKEENIKIDTEVSQEIINESENSNLEKDLNSTDSDKNTDGDESIAIKE